MHASMVLWHGRALIVGPGIDSSPHAHYAAQLTLALERPVRVRSGPDAEWMQTEAVLLAPNQSHQLDCGGAAMAHLFVELPLAIRALESQFDARFQYAPEFSAVRAALQQAACGRLDQEAAGEAARQWLDCALPPLPPLPPKPAHDPRIARVLDWIATHPAAEPDGRTLAAVVHLSESRFTHLFRQQTGLSLSRYLLWARLLDAVEAVAGGASMTVAAHHAGFADLAHMSRSFRNTFGVVPSELQKMTIAFKRN